MHFIYYIINSTPYPCLENPPFAANISAVSHPIIVITCIINPPLFFKRYTPNLVKICQVVFERC